MPWIRFARILRFRSNPLSFSASLINGTPDLLKEGAECAFVPPQHDLLRRAHLKTLAVSSDKGRCELSFYEQIDESAAQRLIGSYVLVYFDDEISNVSADELFRLRGFKVKDIHMGDIGTVREIVDNGAQKLLNLYETPNAKDVLVPFVKTIVLNVDDEKRQIDLDLPSGLMDL